MTLGTFLDAAYVILVEEHKRLGGDLQGALHAMQEFRAGGPSDYVASERSDAAPVARKDTATARQNQQSLAELNKMMAGVKF